MVSVPNMIVTYSKLKKYCDEHGDYDLVEIDNKVLLTFSPTFPEATGKADSIEPKIIMIGHLFGIKVKFDRVEVEDDNGRRIREIEEANMVYQPWLDFIENNY